MMKKFSTDLQKRLAPFVFGALFLIGLSLIVEFLAPRSEPENQFFLGLSLRRFLLGAFFIFWGLLSLVLTVWDRLRVGRLGATIERSANFWSPWVLVVFYLTALLSISLWIAMLPPILGVFKFLRSMREQLDALFLWLFAFMAFGVAYVKMAYSHFLIESRVVKHIERFIFASTIFVGVFFLYAHFAVLIGWVDKGKYAFWDLWAAEFIQGRLYIPNPPYTHDLTLYEGNWYIPMPPLPGILMVPLAYWVGAENINASYFSIFFSALNGVLVFLILEELNQRKWLQLSRSVILVLVVLFLFGTPHLWVGISGRGWFVSQILTVFFLALAIYAALRRWSAWWVGMFIGLAITARPNSLMTWPFVFAISMQLLREKQGRIHLKEAFFWSAKTAIPILLAVAGLLYYNYLRFEDFLDFGYSNINGGPAIVQNVQTWGVFHPHFVPRNLHAMFLELPWINPGGRWLIEPSAAGMSIFLTTPALIYLFRRYPKAWWVIGAWTAILFNIVLLSMYHNTGAHQFGYRYILDLQVPLFAMLAVGMKERIPWHFILLVVLSVVINLYGANWFMNG